MLLQALDEPENVGLHFGDIRSKFPADFSNDLRWFKSAFQHLKDC